MKYITKKNMQNKSGFIMNIKINSTLLKNKIKTRIKLY